MKRSSIILLICTLFAWVGYLVLGEQIASSLAQLMGGRLIQATGGKIANAAVFIKGRAFEALLLWTILLTGTLILTGRGRHFRGRYRWIWLSLAVFILLNAVVKCATQTVLFWVLMFNGESTSPFTQFSFKRQLLQESQASTNVVLLGSSQTRAQLDESLMNRRLGPNYWTTELHFPGCAGLDSLLIWNQIDTAPAELLVVYVSENYFYTGLHSEAAPFFARLQHLPILQNLGLGRKAATEPFTYGYLGQILPLFAVRGPLSDRILGPGLTRSAQLQRDQALESDLGKRAEEFAKLFKLDEAAHTQKKAFSLFLEQAVDLGRTVVLIEGQLNPMVTRLIEPAIREDLRKFLREQASLNPRIILIPAEQVPDHSEMDYADLTHVKPSTQAIFTDWLCTILRSSEARAKN